MLEVEKKYERLLGKQERIIEDMKRIRSSLYDLRQRKINLIWAKKLLLLTIERRQKRFRQKIETIITDTIQATFPDRKFEFKLIFEQKRGKVECRPVVLENGKEQNPEDDMGGSMLDIISLAFRIVLWKMERPKRRNTIIFDEPFKWLGKGEKLEMAGRMLQELSHRMQLQIILITHEPMLMEFADKSFHVIHNGKESEVISERNIRRR